jgi:hypothetical protein
MAQILSSDGVCPGGMPAVSFPYFACKTIARKGLYSGMDINLSL